MKGRRNALIDWLDELQASGRYTFTREDEHREGPHAERKALWRAEREGRLAQPRNGFFVVVPPEYRVTGAPPAPWFIDDLMRFQKQRYYVGLLSAASIHGASAQAVQEFQVMVPAALRPIRAGRLRIHFVQRTNHSRAVTEQRQTPTGWMTISTAEQTALDAARYPAVSGGWDNVASVVRDLAQRLDANKLARVARQQRDVRSTQRLGYLLDRVVRAEDAARALAAVLVRQRTRYVALDSRGPKDAVERDERWHVLVNRSFAPD